MSDPVTSEIHTILDEIAEETETTMLLARDYGSHDAILMSPESDRDVAFLTAHPPAKHVHATQPDERFHYTHELDDGTDVTVAGFSLSRFATDAVQSDPKALTLLAAETEYYRNPNTDSLLASLFAHIEETFHPADLIVHYRRLARSNYEYATSDDWDYTGGDGPQWTIEDRGDRQYLITGLLGYPNKMTSRPVSEAIEAGVLDHKAAEPTVEQNLRFARNLLAAQHVFDTGTLPPSTFADLLTARVEAGADADPTCVAQTPLSEETAESLRMLADRKRNGEGETAVGLVIDDWATPILTSDEFAVGNHLVERELEEASVAYDPSRQPDSERVNEYIDQILTRIES